MSLADDGSRSLANHNRISVLSGWISRATSGRKPLCFSALEKLAEIRQVRNCSFKVLKTKRLSAPYVFEANPPRSGRCSGPNSVNLGHF